MPCLLAARVWNRLPYICELRVRLRIPDAESDTWCPLCDAVLDHHSHHAGMCVAGGERTQRHHAVRDLVHSWAQRAGLRPEREKAGLLLPSNPEETGQANRRASRCVPARLCRVSCCLRFRQSWRHSDRRPWLQASRHTGAAAAAYAQHKELHLDTAQACAAQGVKFMPMVAECTGAWAPEALKVLKHVAHAAAPHSGEEPAVCYGLLLQELAVGDPHFPRTGLSSPSFPSSLTDSAVSCTERYLRDIL